jgi:acetylornithine/N-succinyldiaminopimelate aminotransferase
MNTEHLMQTYRRLPVSFSRGKGIKLWDTHGHEYLDAISGVAVTNLGHAHDEVAHAISEQAYSLLHTSNLFGIDWQSRLGEKLCNLSGMDRAFFCNSGCEANEAALKLARLYGRQQGIAAPTVVVMENSFHGRTLATYAASGNPKAQTGFEFEPMVRGFVRVPFNELDVLRKLAQTRDDIVAILVEPVQGEGGVRLASPEYFGHLRELCNRQGWLLMLDEIQTGIGRTGAWFSYQHEHIFPDVLTLAKALGNGMPIGACLARGKVSSLFAPGSHGSTFGGNPLACRVACTVLDIIERDKLVLRAASLGNLMLQSFGQRLMGIPGVRAIRGHGLMIGIELSSPCAELMETALLNERVLINVTRDSTLRLLPGMLTTDEEAMEIVDRVSRLVTSWLHDRVLNDSH